MCRVAPAATMFSTLGGNWKGVLQGHRRGCVERHRGPQQAVCRLRPPDPSLRASAPRFLLCHLCQRSSVRARLPPAAWPPFPLLCPSWVPFAPIY